jgi:hypothetical protein
MIADRPALSLADLERHDPRPVGRGAERRFLCPFPACADHQRREHKNLACNVETGLWRCCRCDASGKLTDKWEPREQLSPRARAHRIFGLTPRAAAPAPAEASSKSASWQRRWGQAVPIAGTPGADYLARRGIPEAIATAAGVRYLERWEHWAEDDAGTWKLEGTSRRVVFPIVDQVGELVGIHGRAIDEEHHGCDKQTFGAAGVFSTAGSADVLSAERVAVVEGPIDALSLAVLGAPAVATVGTAYPDWLPKALAFKTVLLGHDNDTPDAEGRRAGDDAAAKLAAELGQWGARAERRRPSAKDWNDELLQADAAGLAVLRAWFGSEEQAHVPNPGPNPADAPDEQDEPAPVLVAPYPPPVSIERPTEADVADLVAWLGSVPRPVAAFTLWPWARVVDTKRFYAALQADISQGPTGPRWLAAVEDLRQLARLFSPTEVAEAAA